MQERSGFVDFVIELLGPFGTVQARRMFGGHGVYLDGLCFAIVADEALWLKTDEINRGEFEEVGCDAFAYMKGGRLAKMSYYRAPADAMESASEMLPWARSAYAAALRSHAKQQVEAARRASPKIARAKAASAKRVTSAVAKKPAGRSALPRTRAARKSAVKRPTRHRARRR